MKTDETMTVQTLVSISMKIDALEIKANSIFDNKGENGCDFINS